MVGKESGRYRGGDFIGRADVRPETCSEHDGGDVVAHDAIETRYGTGPHFDSLLNHAQAQLHHLYNESNAKKGFSSCSR